MMYRSSSTKPAQKLARQGRALTWLLCAAAVLFGGASGASAQAGTGQPLVSYLKKGGFVLFIRHLNTNPDQADTDPLHIENVAAQRQLSEEGRARAQALGTALRTLGIPVERVLASKFKRAQDTAHLLALAPVFISTDLTEGGLVVSPNENERRAAVLKSVLVRAPAAGKNLVIVSHRSNLQDAAGKELGDVAEGEIAVFRPTNTGKPKLVQRVPADWWLKWASKVPGAKSVAGAPAASGTTAVAPGATASAPQAPAAQAPAAPASSAPAAPAAAAVAPAAAAVSAPAASAPAAQVPAASLPTGRAPTTSAPTTAAQVAAPTAAAAQLPAAGATPTAAAAR